ncbi:MAG TPA: hypothetical protein VF483_00935 [Gemmatimonadaceae bacterium]
MKAADFLRPKARLGLVVVLTWVVWPFIGVLLDFGYRLSVSTTRKCSVEGCTFDPGLADALVILGPPVIATILWWRHRRKAAGKVTPDSR